jgi:hypothetical protein
MKPGCADRTWHGCRGFCAGLALLPLAQGADDDIRNPPIARSTVSARPLPSCARDYVERPTIGCSSRMR